MEHLHCVENNKASVDKAIHPVCEAYPDFGPWLRETIDPKLPAEFGVLDHAAARHEAAAGGKALYG